MLQRRKRIGIFTAEVATSGGGSRQACLTAERLSQRHEVILISLDGGEKQELSRHFSISLENVRLVHLVPPHKRRGVGYSMIRRFLPEHLAENLQQVPAYRDLLRLRLDLFILNAAFYAMRAPAPRGIIICMFPRAVPTFPRAAWCQSPLVKPLMSRLLANTLSAIRISREL